MPEIGGREPPQQEGPSTPSGDGATGKSSGKGRAGRADLALTAGLVIYVLLLAVATMGELFEVDSILKWFR